MTNHGQIQYGLSRQLRNTTQESITARNTSACNGVGSALGALGRRLNPVAPISYSSVSANNIFPSKYLPSKFPKCPSIGS